MVHMHTAKFWRSQSLCVRSRSLIHINKAKQRAYSKNPKLNELLMHVFTRFIPKEKGSLCCKPPVSFLSFDYYFCDSKLTLSLNLKGKILHIANISEEEAIIKTFKILLRQKIPSWVLNIVHRLKLILLHETCLTNISVSDGGNTTSVFCLLNPKKAMKKDLESYTQLNEVQRQSLRVSAPSSSPPLFQIVEEDPYIKEREELLYKKNETFSMEAMFRDFLKYLLLRDAAIIFHHGTEKFVSTLLVVSTANGKSSVYAFNNCWNIEETLLYFKRIEKSNISKLKLNEFDLNNKEHLQEFIVYLFKGIIKPSKYLSVEYSPLISENLQYVPVMQLNAIPTSINGNCQVVSKIGDVTLTWRSLITLSPYGWLNDLVIDAYLYLIAQRSACYSKLPSVHICNSYFMLQVLNGRVSRLRKNDIFTSDLVLIPYNQGQVHWVLVCIFNKIKTMVYYDSMNGRDRIMDDLENHLQKLAATNPNIAPDPRSIKYRKEFGAAVQQTTTYDCGLFLLMHAEFLSRNAPFTFSQEDMPQIREMVLKELCDEELSFEKPPFYRSKPNTECNINNVSTQSSLKFAPKPLDIAVVVDDYLNLISQRSRMYPDIYPSVYVFSTSVLPTLQSRKQLEEHKAALEFDLLFIPLITYVERHFILFYVEIKSKTILCYNSVNNNEYLSYMDEIEDFLEKLAESTHNPYSGKYLKGLGSAVKLIDPGIVASAVFMLLHAEFLSRKEEFRFTQEQVPEYKEVMMYELHVKRLSSPLPDICPSGFPEIPSNLEFKDEFRTLFFNVKVDWSIMVAYLYLLKKHRDVWLCFDRPADASNKATLLFPFLNKNGYALIAIDKSAQVLWHFNIPTARENLNELKLAQIFLQDLRISDYKSVELPYPKHYIDSGVYVLSFCYSLAGKMEPSFDKRHISYLRKKIYWELMTGCMVFKDEDKL